MCEICGYKPCLPRCPNAPAPPLRGECEWCGAEIYLVDPYYKIKIKPDEAILVCTDCIADCKEEGEETL